MIDVIIDQSPLRAGNCVLYRLELLGDINAGSLFFDHADDAS